MKVKELIKTLSQIDPEATVLTSVEWAKDSAFSDQREDSDVTVTVFEDYEDGEEEEEEEEKEEEEKEKEEVLEAMRLIHKEKKKIRFVRIEGWLSNCGASMDW